MNLSDHDSLAEVAAVAARLIVEDGLELAAAKRQAGRQLGLSARGPWPDNDRVEAAVREHIALFCPESQARELRALRELAAVWMERLAEFQPLVGGAVWLGTATRHSDIHLHLFADDPKVVEWRLLDRRVVCHPGSAVGWQGETLEALTVRDRCPDLEPDGRAMVLVHLLVHGTDDQRGSLKPDAQGRKPRGDLVALRRRLQEEAAS